MSGDDNYSDASDFSLYANDSDPDVRVFAEEYIRNKKLLEDRAKQSSSKADKLAKLSRALEKQNKAKGTAGLQLHEYAEEAVTLPSMDVNQLGKLKEMAANPKLSPALVQDDTWLGLLVLLMDGEEESLVVLTLQILKLLADRKEHRARMKVFIGMVQQLEDLLNGRETSSAVYDLAEEVHSLLLGVTTSNTSTQSHGNHSHYGNGHKPLQDIKDTSVKQSSRTETKIGQKGRRNSMLVRGYGLGKNAKTVVLQIKGMVNRDDMDLCRSLLVKVKGVISITFDFKKKRSILRCRTDLKPNILVEAITKSITMTADQVVKDDQGQEAYVSFSVKPSVDNKENLQMPDYPSDDDDSPIKGDKNMARMGSATDSPGSWGFIKSVGNYLSSSFYW